MSSRHDDNIDVDYGDSYMKHLFHIFNDIWMNERMNELIVDVCLEWRTFYNWLLNNKYN